MAQRQLFQLAPADQQNLDYLGYSMAVDSGLIFAGAPFNHDGGLWAGSIYTFEAASGLERLEILPPDPNLQMGFGWCVDADGGLAVVGAPFGEVGGVIAGSAYVVDAFSGQVVHKLVPPKPSVGLLFGTDVVIGGSWIAVAAPATKLPVPGRVYVFDRATGTLVHTLIGSLTQNYTDFGCSLAMDGSHLLVGERRGGAGGVGSGAAYLFDLTTGQELLMLTPSDGEAADSFGSSVAMSTKWIVVGAENEGAKLGERPGAAYLFDRLTGNERRKLFDYSLEDWSLFGRSVAVSGDTVLVGAPWDSFQASNAGSVHRFDASTGEIVQRITDSGSGPEEFFGFDVILANDRTLIGSYGKGVTFNDSGTVTAFDLAPAVGSSFCLGSTNSSGSPGMIYATGSDRVADGDLTLKAVGLPTNQPAYFINSTSQTLVFNPRGSQGILCLAGIPGRHMAQMGSTGGGYFELTLDLGAIPTASGLRAVLVGETWNWQLWFRDRNPGPTSNLTDGVSVTFQ